jgi:hypothetical protein
VLRYIGFAVGSALSATVLEAATEPTSAFPVSDGYAAIGLIGLGACVVLAVLTAVLPDRGLPPSSPAALARTAVGSPGAD